LDPPCTKFNPPTIDWSLLDSLESNLLEPETEMDLRDDHAHDFLLDQDVASVTLCYSSRPPVCYLAPYKRMQNFCDCETGLPQPLLSVLEDNMDVEEVEVSRVDSPSLPAPVPAPSSQQDATLLSEVPSNSASDSDSNPVELQHAAERSRAYSR